MRRRLLRIAFSLIAAAAVLGLLHVWIHLRVIQLAYELAKETNALEAAEAERRRLRAEVAYLKSPERLEPVAREKIGMIALEPDAIRVVRIGGAARSPEEGR